MKLQRQLSQSLRSRGIIIDPEALNLFMLKPQPIKDEPRHMSIPSITNIIKQYHLTKYGKELINVEIIKESVKQIAKKYGHLAIRELQYVINQIIAGNYTVSNYSYNIADLMQALRRYDGIKKAITSSYFDLKKQEQNNEQFNEDARIFLEEAKRLYTKGEPLTIYHKSALGKHLIDQLTDDEVKTCKELTDANLEQKIRELTKIRKAGFESFLDDDEMIRPLAWSEPLLFGVYLFNIIAPDYE
jgi:hypothetical protein